MKGSKMPVVAARGSFFAVTAKVGWWCETESGCGGGSVVLMCGSGVMGPVGWSW